MRKDLGLKNYLYPQPVLILQTYDKDGNVDAMNAAWGGISDAYEITISLSKYHKTVSNLKESKAMCISPATLNTLGESDYFGVVSANDVKNKIENVHFHAVKSKHVNAPIILEYPLTLECELLNYDDERELATLKIINTSVDDSILTNNKIDIKKLQPISFDACNNKYVLLSDNVGNAFKDGLKLKK